MLEKKNGKVFSGSAKGGWVRYQFRPVHIDFGSHKGTRCWLTQRDLRVVLSVASLTYRSLALRTIVYLRVPIAFS